MEDPAALGAWPDPDCLGPHAAVARWAGAERAGGDPLARRRGAGPARRGGDHDYRRPRGAARLSGRPLTAYESSDPAACFPCCGRHSRRRARSCPTRLCCPCQVRRGTAHALARIDGCDPEPLRPAFQSACDAWMGVAHLTQGPAEEEGRGLSVLVWPDPKGGWPEGPARASWGAILPPLPLADPVG